ncbi:MAG: FAD-dependent oxidoreductase [Burkholderiaceae bacterium]|nr:FAD-dependent oxidoreductase [Burkholderiaceae bacterium]
MTEPGPIVIVGAGHAGVQLCVGLVAAGLGSHIHLVCEEPDLPYQRPPLSKTFLKSPGETLQLHRTEDWFNESGIHVYRADPAVDIDRSRHVVELRSGTKLHYRTLVLATGTRARRLPHLPDGLSNVAVLRTAADALCFRERLSSMSRLTVVGGGFIGLEVAATVRNLGKTVDVLESAPRLLMRSVSPELAQHVLQVHRASGIDLRLGVAVGGFEVAGDRLQALHVGGALHEVDMLLLGIGAMPEHTLATQAGLDCDNGILVDPHMRTSDPNILAIGDCSSFPGPIRGRLRLESVQNANDQAKAAVGTLTGALSAFYAVPWFWSEQGSLRLQMVGLMPVDGIRHRRPGTTPTSFSLLHYAGGQLACVESVNAPVDHMAARKLLEANVNPSPEAACDPSRPLKSFL